jgi:hypothetical protein
VKCPKCTTIFSVAVKPTAPAFEVVEDEPAPAPKRKAEPLEPDFDVVEEPRSRKRAVPADDDDDRPRSKRRRDDRDDRDDDDDDRPRRKGRRRDYDEEDDWQPAAKGGSFGPARVGMLMLSISLWIYLATFALLGLFVLIAWMGASIPDGLMIVIGLLGISNWIVALIGLGFCIAGPAKSRGLAIAATAVAVIHLIMAFVVANNEKSGYFGASSIQALSGLNKLERFTDIMKRIEKETDPRRRDDLQKELRDLSESERGKKAPFELEDGRPTLRAERAGPDMRWRDLGTLNLYSDQFIAVLAYQSKGFSDYILALLAGLLEVARLVLIVLLIGAVARAARDRHLADRSLLATFLAGGATILAMVILVLIAVIVDNSKPSTVKSPDDLVKEIKGMMTWPILGELAVYGVHLASLVLPAILALGARNAALRRSR